jgi:hypothetical protein
MGVGGEGGPMQINLFMDGRKVAEAMLPNLAKVTNLRLGTR